MGLNRQKKRMSVMCCWSWNDPDDRHCHRNHTGIRRSGVGALDIRGDNDIRLGYCDRPLNPCRRNEQARKRQPKRESERKLKPTEHT